MYRILALTKEKELIKEIQQLLEECVTIQVEACTDKANLEACTDKANLDACTDKANIN